MISREMYNRYIEYLYKFEEGVKENNVENNVMLKNNFPKNLEEYFALLRAVRDKYPIVATCSIDDYKDYFATIDDLFYKKATRPHCSNLYCEYLNLIKEYGIKDLKEIIEEYQQYLKPNLLCYIENLNYDYNVDGNNSVVHFDDEDVISVIEAPNHTTLAVVINFEELITNMMNLRKFLENKYKLRIEEFDVDDYFNEVWSEQFSKHNDLKPSQFLRMLEEDKQYFKENPDIFGFDAEK